MARTKPANEIQLPRSQAPEELVEEGDEEEELDFEVEEDPSDGVPSRPTGTRIGRTVSFGASYQGNDPRLMARPTSRDGSVSAAPSAVWTPRRITARQSSPRERALT